MCESKEHGGKRCDNNTSKHTRTLLRARILHNKKAGNEDLVARDENKLDHLEKARKKYGNVVTFLDLDVPDTVEDVFSKLRADGYTPLIVGGSVRDAISGDLPKDIDVEVYGATIDQVAAALRRQGLRVDEVGKAFGVLKVVLSDGVDLDISVPRRDNHVGAGHRGFTVETDADMSVEEASSRRDFTVNAINYDPEHRVAVDPHHGREDLDNKILRHVSDAFAEDPLRVLRGFQFAGRYQMKMHPDTVEFCRTLVPQASDIAQERVRGEWHKFYLKSVDHSKGLGVLKDTQWDSTVTGLQSINNENLGQRINKAASLGKEMNLDREDHIALLSGTIAHHMNERDAFSFSRETIEGSEIQKKAFGLSQAQGISNFSDGDVRRWSRSLKELHTSPRMWFAKSQVVDSDNSELNKSLHERAIALGVDDGPQRDLLQGRHLLELVDLSPGPWMGKLLKKARAAQDEGTFTNLEDSITWAKKELDLA